MITPQSASIIWAVLATGLGIGIYFAMRSQVRSLDKQGYGQYVRAEKLAGQVAQAKSALTAAQDAANYYSRCWRDETDEHNKTHTELCVALDELRTIKLSRHNAAVKARQAQLSQQRAKVLAKASELTPVPVDTRKAA